MNADYYNAEPGYRSIDEMFWECERVRDEDEYGHDEPLENALEEELGDSEPETSDDIDDAYDREREDDYEGEEDFD